MDKSKRVILSLVVIGSLNTARCMAYMETCFDTDTDYPGNDINLDTVRSTPKATALECQDLCSKTNGCNYFSWSPNQRCYLKSSKSRKGYETGAISGRRKCKNDDVFGGSLGAGRDFNMLTVDYMGVIAADSRQECCRVCRREHYGTKLYGYGYKSDQWQYACVCFGLDKSELHFRPATVPEGGSHGKGTPLLTQYTEYVDVLNEECPDGCPLMSTLMTDLYAGVC